MKELLFEKILLHILLVLPLYQDIENVIEGQKINPYILFQLEKIG